MREFKNQCHSCKYITPLYRTPRWLVGDINIETGLRAQGTESRSRIENQKIAFNRLAKLIISYENATSEQRRQWNEIIRNYHAVRNEVHDKASGLKLLYRDVVEKNNIAPMIDARRDIMSGKHREG